MHDSELMFLVRLSQSFEFQLSSSLFDIEFSVFQSTGSNNNNIWLGSEWWHPYRLCEKKPLSISWPIYVDESSVTLVGLNGAFEKQFWHMIIRLLQLLGENFESLIFMSSKTKQGAPKSFNSCNDVSILTAKLVIFHASWFADIDTFYLHLPHHINVRKENKRFLVWNIKKVEKCRRSHFSNLLELSKTNFTIIINQECKSFPTDCC